MASSSANAISPRPNKYQVFLSFRGTDTRNGFLGHLYAALTGKGIRTYMDENSLERGSEIAYSLVEAIQESEASVVVLSENYGGSWWCLDELVQIIRCRERNGLIVVPVFYRVEPTHVRKQVGKFGDAFSELKERFKDNEEKVTSWTKALTSVADLSGWDSSVIRSEAELLDKIVKDVKRKLERKSRPSKDTTGLVGIGERVEKIKSLLCISNQDRLAIGIWGMGGIGKTTLAKEVFSELCYEFECCCFVDDVRENWENGKKEELRNKLHSELLGEEDPYNAQERLSNKKVLVVLDDVNDQEQFEFLLRDGFGDGSRVIVTTRDKQMLRYLDAEDFLYKVKELNQCEALELFLKNAFKTTCSSDLDAELSHRAVSYAQGVPLAIKVLGSYLRCKKKENWAREMDKLERSPNDKIQNVLKISYDGLDETNKKIFLDVACFFKGNNREDVEPILDGCGFYAKEGIDDLIDKSLLTISDNHKSLLTISDNQLWMHDLIQEMGRKIVNSTEKREERSRLWNAEDVVHVLKNNIGSKELQGIVLDTTKIDELDLSPVVFTPMHNLRLLKIEDHGKQKLHFPNGLRALPDELRYLYWYNFPLKSLPSKFTPHNLVELDMSFSHLRQLWDGVQNLANMKHINFSFSTNLTRIPDLSLAPNLESVKLFCCTSLVQIPPLSFRVPEQRASNKYSSLKVNGTLDLSICSSLEALPKISGHLAYLDLSKTTVGELSASSVSLDNLTILSLVDCNLTHLPSNICLAEDLGIINLSFSSSFKKFPDELPRNIVHLDLSGTAIEHVPPSIEHVSNTLEKLYLPNCKRLRSLPANLHKLKKLEELKLYGCSNLEEFPGKFPPNLLKLNVTGCTSLERVPDPEVLAQARWCDYNCMSLKLFVFRKCHRLNEDARRNLLIEYQIRILRVATMPQVRRLDSDTNSITFCFPGNEIPEWFRCRSEEPWITVDLPENWHSTEFIGFAVCVSVTFEDSDLHLECVHHYRNINNSRTRKFSRRVFENYTAHRHKKDAVLESDHLFMWYIEKNHRHYLDAVKITFEFKFSYCLFPDRLSCDNKVNRCGVRMLNREDSEKFGFSNEVEPKQ